MEGPGLSAVCSPTQLSDSICPMAAPQRPSLLTGGCIPFVFVFLVGGQCGSRAGSATPSVRAYTTASLQVTLGGSLEPPSLSLPLAGPVRPGDVCQAARQLWLPWPLLVPVSAGQWSGVQESSQKERESLGRSKWEVGRAEGAAPPSFSAGAESLSRCGRRCVVPAFH